MIDDYKIIIIINNNKSFSWLGETKPQAPSFSCSKGSLSEMSSWSWFSIHWMQHLCCLLCPKASTSDKGNRRILKGPSRPCFSVQLLCLDRNLSWQWKTISSHVLTLWQAEVGLIFIELQVKAEGYGSSCVPSHSPASPCSLRGCPVMVLLPRGWHCKHGTSEQAAPFVIKSDWHKVHKSQRRNRLSTLPQVLNSLMSNTVKHA